MDSKEGKRKIISTKEKNKETSAMNKSIDTSGQKPKAAVYTSKAKTSCEMLPINTEINHIHVGLQELSILCDMMTKL